MYCLLTTKTVDITHFLLESYKTTRTKHPVTTSVVAGFLICGGIRKDGTSAHTGAKSVRGTLF